MMLESDLLILASQHVVERKSEMKKAAVAAALIFTAVGSFVMYENRMTPRPVAAEEQEETSDETAGENSLVPQIDTTADVMSGARIAVVSKCASGQYWDLLRTGMEDAVRDVNEAYGFQKDEQITMTFEGPDDEKDVETQINTLDAVIAENPTVVCLSAGDMESCQAQLEAARENGIPVIVFDSNVSETELITGYCGTDNVEVGIIAAQKMVQALGEKGQIAVFSAQEKTQSARERTDSFLDVIAGYENMSVVSVLYDDQVENMESAMQDALKCHPDIAGVFCSNAVVADLYLNMEKEEDAAQPLMVGVDATTRQQEAIKNGGEVGTVSQNPYAMGYRTMWMALQVSSETGQGGEKISDYLPPEWIDAQNLEDPAYAGYIYGK